MVRLCKPISTTIAAPPNSVMLRRTKELSLQSWQSCNPCCVSSVLCVRCLLPCGSWSQRKTMALQCFSTATHRHCYKFMVTLVCSGQSPGRLMILCRHATLVLHHV